MGPNGTIDSESEDLGPSTRINLDIVDTPTGPETVQVGPDTPSDI